MPWEISDILGEDVFNQGWEALQTLPALKRTIGSLDSDRTAISTLEFEWYMRGQLLRDSDWASMAHSLELRVPFVDVDLFREVATLIGSGFSPSKLDMARACKKQLPESVFNKPKTGFSVPVQEWLMGQSQASKHNRHQDLKKWSDMIYRSFN
jgi:asparagine synthase (glutamine-hydrolysing)